MKKILMMIIVALILVTSLAVAGGKQEADSGKLKIAIISQFPYIDFFVPTRIGALDAGKEYGVDVIWQGPETQDVSKLISIVETQIDAGIDGLAIQAANPAALKVVLDKAEEKGIPVICFNNTKVYEGYDGFVGIEPEYVGEFIGETAVKILQGEGAWAKEVGYDGTSKPQGQVAYLHDNPGAYNVEGRVKGMKTVMDQHSGIQDIGTYDVTQQGMAKAKEVVENIITANPNTKLFLSAAAPSTAAAGMIVKEKNLVGKTIVVGMDLLEDTLRLIQEGVIAAAVGQDPYNQGYLPVKLLVENLRDDKPIPKVTSTEPEVVDISNVDDVIKREAEYLEAGTKLPQE